MRSARLAWWLAGVSAVLTVADFVVVQLSTGLVSEEAVGIHGSPLVNLATMGSSVLGAVIIGANSRQPIGWLLALVGFTTSVSLLAESYGVWVLDYDGPGTQRQGEIGQWVASLLGGPMALAALTLVFLLVPSGHWLSSRWRWVAMGSVVGYAAFAFGTVLIGPHGVSRRGKVPEGSTFANALLSLGILLIAITLVAAVACMLIRLRRSQGEARQQLRLVALGAASIAFALVFLLVAQSFNGGDQSWWSSMPLFAAYTFLLGCIAVAVLRYRLYDVDVIVSRGLVLAIATAFVAAGYVGIVVTLSRTVENQANGGFGLSLLATVVVALAFQPLRRSVVRLADRLAYGTRAAPYDALADFSRRIGQSPAPGVLLPTIAAAAAEVVHADRAVVRLDVDGAAARTGVWPSGQDDSVTSADVRIPIEDRAGPLGSIGLDLPPGRDIRPLEQRLLADIADQAAIAFRNARLQVELSARVEQLDGRTRELAASRNRIIGAADTERRRVEAAIARQVLPTLSRLRTDLADSRRHHEDTAAAGEYVEQATQALESLRELTRGIFPTMLTRAGLGPALTSYVSRQERAHELSIDSVVAETRYSARIEATVYFCCVEALAQRRDDLGIKISQEGSRLHVYLHGVDLDAMDRLAVTDRVEACGGSLNVVQLHGQTSLQITIPVAPELVSAD